MGKGKGKILGRVLRVRPGEVFLDVKIKNFLRMHRQLKALRQALPSTSTMVFRNKWAARTVNNFYRARAWYTCKKPKKKKKV